MQQVGDNEYVMQITLGRFLMFVDELGLCRRVSQKRMNFTSVSTYSSVHIFLSL